jgi:glycerol-3-phosphate dehydrogenase (NAD(P)+)
MNIAVIGAGSWGTALALLLHGQHNAVRVWEFDPGLARRYRDGLRENPVLPGVPLPEGLAIRNELDWVLEGAELVLLAVPSHAVRTTAARLAALCPPAVLLVDVAKGVEEGTLKRMSEVVAEAWPALAPERILCLSGPSHAEEVSRQLPTSVTIAGIDLEQARRAQRVFSGESFRVYVNDDLCGVELGGALKNVIAIASGMCDGLGFGDNTKGALLTRGLVEISRLGTIMGGRPETFAGLSGMGDLFTTCMSRHSRNRHVGEQVGRGRPLAEVLGEMTMVAEGVRTTHAARELGRRHGVPMPITEAVHRALFEGADVRTEVTALMTRELREE